MCCIHLLLMTATPRVQRACYRKNGTCRNLTHTDPNFKADNKHDFWSCPLHEHRGCVAFLVFERSWVRISARRSATCFTGFFCPSRQMWISTLKQATKVPYTSHERHVAQAFGKWRPNYPEYVSSMFLRRYTCPYDLKFYCRSNALSAEHISHHIISLPVEPAEICTRTKRWGGGRWHGLKDLPEIQDELRNILVCEGTKWEI